jgi:hypothetical protein
MLKPGTKVRITFLNDADGVVVDNRRTMPDMKLGVDYAVKWNDGDIDRVWAMTASEVVEVKSPTPESGLWPDGSVRGEQLS